MQILNGRVIFNLFKSTDLINWTSISKSISDGEKEDPVYRYAIGIPEDINNKTKYSSGKRLQTITWSPKWFQDGDDVYLVVSSTRYTEDGKKLVYVKAKTIMDNPNTYKLNIPNYNEEEFKLYSILLSMKIENNKIKYDFYLDSKGNIIKSQCPDISGPVYPILDQYITKVNFGTEEEQKDINNKNLKFENIHGNENGSILTKVQFKNLNWEDPERK